MVLFNTWNQPPSGVEREEPAGSEAAVDIHASPRGSWQSAPLHVLPAAQLPQTSMKLWLLGDRARRGREDRTLKLAVDGEALQRALNEAAQCTKLER